jgi:hypothetical protein
MRNIRRMVVTARARDAQMVRILLTQIGQMGFIDFHFHVCADVNGKAGNQNSTAGFQGGKHGPRILELTMVMDVSPMHEACHDGLTAAFRMPGKGRGKPLPVQR